ncbi:MAG: class I mannose-6-phosphate isomerase [Oscillospiraceae bacterium]|nr:class I mannose-6-phosphate isomerase [Oscillospiraceae bacterium]
MTMKADRPLFLRNVARDYIWGGTKLSEHYGKGSGCIAESWELFDDSLVENGSLRGQTLRQVLGASFPLMVKFLDAREQLSVQVHPSDENALAGERGKEELWYVLAAEPGSYICCGLSRDMTVEELRAAAVDGSIETQLQKLPVAPGDSIYIAPGIVHALGAGVLVAEYAQNSDTTFRLYDYGRGRPLHLDRACAVAECRAGGCAILPETAESGLREILRTPHFRLRRLINNGCMSLCARDCQHLLVLEGEGSLHHRGKAYGLYSGASVFLAAGLGDYSIEGPCRVLIADQ